MNLGHVYMCFTSNTLKNQMSMSTFASVYFLSRPIWHQGVKPQYSQLPISKCIGLHWRSSLLVPCEPYMTCSLYRSTRPQSSYSSSFSVLCGFYQCNSAFVYVTVVLFISVFPIAKCKATLKFIL